MRCDRGIYEPKKCNSVQLEIKQTEWITPVWQVWGVFQILLKTVPFVLTQDSTVSRENILTVIEVCMKHPYLSQGVNCSENGLIGF